MKVAVLAADGVEQVELDRPWQALEEAGAEPELVSLRSGTITAYDHIDKADTRTVDAVVSSADPATGRHQLTGHPHGVRRVHGGAAGEPPPQQAAQLGSGTDGHVGNRSAPVCAPSGRRVAAAPWQEN